MLVRRASIVYVYLILQKVSQNLFPTNVLLKGRYPVNLSTQSTPGKSGHQLTFALLDNTAVSPNIMCENMVFNKK